MTKQEIEFVDIIADDDFSVPGGMVRKDELFRCTRGKAKELVAINKAHYPTEDEREALAEKAIDAEPEGDAEKRDETQATSEPSTGATAGEAAEATAEEATAKAETPKATKSPKASK